MKTLKLYTLLFLTALILPAAAVAQSTLGTVRAFSVIGEVTLRNDQTREVVPLTTGRDFTEGFTVRTGAGSSVLLVQSNGSTIELEENSSLSITEFLQDPYDTSAGRYTRLEEDPSTSRTRVRVNYGDVTGEVKRLRSTSSYNVDVPTGSAGIRGTIWRVVVEVNFDTGDIRVSFVVPEGALEVESADGDVIEITAGQGLQMGGQMEEGSTEDDMVVLNITRQEVEEADGDLIRETVQKTIEAMRRARQEQDEADPGDDDGDPEPDPDEEPGDERPERDANQDLQDVEGDSDDTPEGDEQRVVDEFSPSGANDSTGDGDT